ncbi:hypothetical protein AMECASPLE_033086 [Ameca splendens]|uniref:Uncharacterized protein n=1 Tax=Ameca splendens TaxID=208324 RepID=A0ABV0Z5I3_9TELE
MSVPRDEEQKRAPELQMNPSFILSYTLQGSRVIWKSLKKSGISVFSRSGTVWKKKDSAYLQQYTCNIPELAKA